MNTVTGLRKEKGGVCAATGPHTLWSGRNMATGPREEKMGTCAATGPHTLRSASNASIGVRKYKWERGCGNGATHTQFGKNAATGPRKINGGGRRQRGRKHSDSGGNKRGDGTAQRKRGDVCINGAAHTQVGKKRGDKAAQIRVRQCVATGRHTLRSGPNVATGPGKEKGGGVRQRGSKHSDSGGGETRRRSTQIKLWGVCCNGAAHTHVG